MSSVHGSFHTVETGALYSAAQLEAMQRGTSTKKVLVTIETPAEPGFKEKTVENRGGMVDKLFNRQGLVDKLDVAKSAAKAMGKTLSVTKEAVTDVLGKTFQKTCNRILVKMGSPTSQEALKHLDAFREKGELPDGISPGVGREILQQATRTKMKPDNLTKLKSELDSKIPFNPEASVNDLVEHYALAKELGKPPEELKQLRHNIEKLLISKNDDEAGRKELWKKYSNPNYVGDLTNRQPRTHTSTRDDKRIQP